RNPADQPTKLSASEFIQPLADWMVKETDWSVQALLKNEATKANLAELLNSPDGPALLFTAAHGMGFPNGDPRQLPLRAPCSARTGPASSNGGANRFRRIFISVPMMSAPMPTSAG
ncbi:MAG: hypothetical protein D3909_16390, partial [Candidatus Electrothrix sp. ATG1]|nr:hypothetical protein [Candidatus Electrothrix sp. ATG1]